MLPAESLEAILARIPALRVAVVGDLFLDRYLDLDASLSEPSLETGLDAYQVVNVRPSPGAAGTVINNLVALGVSQVFPVAAIGDDGEGYELRQCLARMPAVNAAHVFSAEGRRTPTYTKPMLCEPGCPPRELNRLDVHNRSPLPAEAERRVLDAAAGLWGEVDGIVVLDQVSLPDTGVVTAAVRELLAVQGRRHPGLPVVADSRERIGLFREIRVKPNERECLRATGEQRLDLAAAALARRTGRTVFCTRSESGILVARPDGSSAAVPGYPVDGPADPVGAGDSTSAGIIVALASGAGEEEAAAFGNLVASVTVQQLGTTGTASPAQVRQRWGEVNKG